MAQAQFLFQMLFNRFADLQAFDGIVLHTAQHFIQPEGFILINKQDIFISFLTTYIIDLIAIVQTASAGFGKKVIIPFDCNCLAGNLPFA